MGGPIQVDETSCNRFLEIRATYGNVIFAPIIRCSDPAARKDKAMWHKARVRRPNEGIFAHTAWSHHQKQRPAGCHAHRPYIQMSIRPKNRTVIEFGQGDAMAKRLPLTQDAASGNVATSEQGGRGT
jgi:hypothetical protein